MAPARRPCSGSPQLAPPSSTLPPPCASPSSPSPLFSPPPPPLLSSPSQAFPPLPLAARVSSASVAGSGSGVAGSSVSASCPIVSGGEIPLVESRAESLPKSAPSSHSLCEDANLKPNAPPGALGELNGGGPGGSSCSSGDGVTPAAGASSASLVSSIAPSWASIVNKSSMDSGTPLKFFPPFLFGSCSGALSPC